MDKPKLSVILPVYNTEKYIIKCIESILNNTFKDYELIIINDGSTDGSDSIIQEYADKEKDRIRYIKKENSGISDTRNLGVKLAVGQYITFVDSDDYISPHMYEELYKKAKENEFDIVACDARIIYENSDKQQVVSCGYVEDLFGQEKIKKTVTFQYPVLWNKWYKKELFLDLYFTKGVWYEDMELLLKMYPRINSIGVVKKAMYYYLQRANSITATYNEKLYDIIKNMDSVIAHYKSENKYDCYKEELEYLYARYAYATFAKRLAKCRNKEKYNAGISYAKSKVKETFPQYKNNKYLKGSLKGAYIKHFSKTLSKLTYIVESNIKHN